MSKIVDVNKEVAERFMKRPQLVSIAETNRTGWFTDIRVDRSIEVDGVSVVQIRHSDMGWIPCTIEDNIMVNHYGDLLISDETYDVLVSEGYEESRVYYYIDGDDDIIEPYLINPVCEEV